MVKQMTAYDIEPELLIDRFAVACARSGVANSGLCIDIGGADHALNVQYLHGVLLARFLSKTPPFRPGQKVRMKKDAMVGFGWRPSPPDRILTIERVFFERPDHWRLVFQEYDQYDDNGRLRDRQRAELFEVVQEEAKAV